MARNGTYYLNNRGDRWAVFNEGVKVKIKVFPDKENKLTEPIIRTAVEFRQWGNYAAAFYWIKGDKYSTINYELVN